MAQMAAFKTDLLTDEARDAGRHPIRLTAEAAAKGDMSDVLIHNLSGSGLLIESTLALDLGDEFDIDLPEVGTTRAQIVWRSDSFYGCQFVGSVSAAAVSAARLRSPAPASSPQLPQVLAAPLAIPNNEGELATDAGPRPLAAGQKAAVIVGLALACWAPIIAAAIYLL